MTAVDVPAAAPEAFLRFADAALGAALEALEPTGACGQPPRKAWDAELQQARIALEGGSAQASPFASLCANAHANGSARELLAIVIACELDIARSTRAAALSGAHRPMRLTLGAAAALLGGVPQCAQAAGPGSPLSRGALIDVVQEGTWATAEIALAPSVLWALAGDPTPDRGLPIGAWILETGPTGRSSAPVVFVSGADRVRRRVLAAQNGPGGPLLVCPTPESDAAWAAVVREATLTGCGVMIELTADLPPVGRRWIERAAHVAWAVTSATDLPLADMPDRARIELLASDELASDGEWQAALGTEVARSHRLTAHQLELVANAYPGVGNNIDLAVRRLLAGLLGTLARRVRPTKTWSDLVLSDAKIDQLRTIAARYRHADTVYDSWGLATASGRGIVSLFTGPSGTGKTLAAEVVATSLELDMYRIDLSSVVSKYIGETEQNLEKLFAAASAGNSVLFFDEADSLFGKRSEVKDGRDRYANLEVSYLLQRLENYDGIVVLATNLPKNIDDAFLRRIHEIIDFTVPGPPERRAIWARHLAGGIPQDDLDLDYLATTFEITGGIIRNVVVSGAFRAADDGRPLAMSHLLPALAAEYRKLGRIINVKDFDAS
ncbi:MAG: putative ATPase [Jatrophihabitantaceae bacterium]|nr:putative ATPase [Jatrophihabitantaceae bacterium]